MQWKSFILGCLSGLWIALCFLIGSIFAIQGELQPDPPPSTSAYLDFDGYDDI